MEEIPGDALVEILSRLPLKTLARLRCVCKPWRSLTYDPAFIKKHQAMAASAASTLFSAVGPANASTTLCKSDGHDGEIAQYAPLLKWHVLSNSVDGLLCGFGGRALFLLNPSASDVARLPPPPDGAVASISLGFDASAGAYKVLWIAFPVGFSGDFECAVLTVGAGQEWRSVEDEDDEESPSPFPHGDRLYLNGFIHWVDPGDELISLDAVLGVFDCKDETLFSVTIPGSARFKQAELASFGGHLCFAGAHESSLTIMMLEDYARPVWTTLFVINCGVLSTPLAEHRIIGIKDGRILLQGTWNQEDGVMVVHSYDLRSKLWSQMICRREFQELRLYTESLVSPRNLLNQLME